MQLLMLFSLFLSAVVCDEQAGSYNYEYSMDHINRREMRYPNGTTVGDYTFNDENGQTHEVQFTSGADQGFKVISHVVTGNGQTVHLSSDYTPEVQAARDTHITFQNYLRTVLPQLAEDEVPPVYIRHVPSPVKHEPIVPIIPVIPPQRVLRRQFKSAQNLHEQVPQQVVQHVPARTQFGARSVVVENFPAFTEVKVEETPVRFGSRNLQYFGQRVATPPPLQRPDHEYKQVHFGDRISHHVEQQQGQAVHVPVQEVSQFVQQQHYQHHQQQQQPILTAQDVHLVNGFTPEVARATQEHLSHVAAIKAVLPNIEA